MERASRVWVAVAVAVAALAVVGVAARSGRTTTVTAVTRATPVPDLSRTPSPVPSSKAERGGAQQDPPGDVPTWVLVLLSLLLATVVVVVGLGLWTLGRRGRPALWWWQGRAGPTAAPGRPDPPPPLTEAVDTGLLLLAEGEPTDAVVACWVALEQAAAEAGTARRPAETSTELAERVLAAHRVTAEPLRVLGGLYREARYSPHVLGEDARAAARTALEQVRRELRGEPAGVPP